MAGVCRAQPPGKGGGARASSAARAAGLVIGVLLDAALGDPRCGHPVAAFGRAAAALERRWYGDSRGRGVAYAGVLVGAVTALGVAVERWAARHPARQAAATAVAAWTVLGGRSLAREAERIGGQLRRGDTAAARAGLPALCARDPSGLDAAEIARAVVESVAENTSDAVVAPLLWGAVGGVPGLLGYRAVNTLDAMVGYRSPRYQRFGWAAARLDDLANLVPARVTGRLTIAAAWCDGRDARRAARVLRRDGGAHPSPNAGRCEAAMAGALGVRLGGVNHYHGVAGHRPVLGAGGRPAGPEDIPAAVRLAGLVGVGAAIVAAGAALARAARPCRAFRVEGPGPVERSGGGAARGGFR